MTEDSAQNRHAVVERACHGDRAAIDEIFLNSHARLFALAYAELRDYDDASDAVAAGFLQICLHIDSLRQPERIDSWMQTIVRNEARRIRRGRLVANTLPLAENDKPVVNTDSTLLRLDLERALQHIPPQQSDALRRFYLSETPIAAIADDMAAAQGAVKMWLHRGRHNLRRELEGYGPMTSATTVAQTLDANPPATAAKTNGSGRAAILQSSLAPEARKRMSAAMRRAGYSPVYLAPEDLGEPGSTQASPWDVLREFAVCIIVEPFGRRSVYEYLLLLGASWETAEIPVAVVTQQHVPDTFQALAFHRLGVAGIASLDAPESLDCLFQWTGGGGWSNEVKGAVLFADDEARRAGDERIGTEHLLLGLLRDAGVAKFFRDTANEPPAQIAELIRRRITIGPEYSHRQWRELTDEAATAMQLAREEANAGDAPTILTAVHLLSGLACEPNGRAGQVLAELRITDELIHSSSGR